MTWALKPSDKAVTANSESAFSVGELNFQVVINAWPQLHKKNAHPTDGYILVLQGEGRGHVEDPHRLRGLRGQPGDQ